MPDSDNLAAKQEYLRDTVINTLTSLDLEEAIRHITMELGKLFNADRVHFRLYDEDMGVFSAVIEEYRKSEDIPSSKGKMIYPEGFDKYLKNKLLLEEKHIFIIDDINSPEYSESFKEFFRNLNINNEIIFPIFYRDKLESAFFITNTESQELISRQNLEYLMPIARELSVGIHLFKVQDTITKKLEYEKILREIIMEIKSYEHPLKVFEYLVNRLADIYKVNRVAHLQIDSLGNFVVVFEARRDQLSDLTGQTMFEVANFDEITAFMEDDITVVNDIDQIKNTQIRQCLSVSNIRAFMFYPLKKIQSKSGEKVITDRIMISSAIPRVWNKEEIESLKLIVGTIVLIYADILKKEDIKDIQETFLASLIHDLRSPILGEQKALEFIMSRKPETTIKEIAYYHHDMYKTNENLLFIINNLLSVSSLELGQHELKKELSNINRIIYETIRTVKPLADDNEDTINLDTQEHLSEIMFDPDEINRVIVNLLGNAIRHNPKGTNINITAQQKENDILVSIADNGIGISESEKVKIFQRYPGGKSKIGAGLGLYLSKQIIGLHGGKIWFDSEEGKGTTFYFTLPI